MIKNIVREYFAAFRLGNIKESYQKNNWWFFIYILTFLPMMMFSGRMKTFWQILAYYMLMLPVVFELFAVPLHPFALPKIMYLCPLTKQERREYLVKTYWMKVLFPCMVELAVVIGLAATGQYDNFLLETAFILNMMLVFSISLQTRTIGADFNMSTSKDRWETAALVVLLFQIIFLTVGVIEWEECSGVGKAFCAGVLLLLDLPLTLKVLSFWKDTVEDMMHYEKQST